MRTIEILLIRAELSKSQCCYKAMSVTIKFVVVVPSVISFSYSLFVNVVDRGMFFYSSHKFPIFM